MAAKHKLSISKQTLCHSNYPRPAPNQHKRKFVGTCVCGTKNMAFSGVLIKKKHKNQPSYFIDQPQKIQEKYFFDST
jgi:hypothetical protein